MSAQMLHEALTVLSLKSMEQAIDLQKKMEEATEKHSALMCGTVATVMASLCIVLEQAATEIKANHDL